MYYYDDLMERMIHLYGFEHSATIQFCRLCETERYTRDEMKLLLEMHEHIKQE